MKTIGTVSYNIHCNFTNYGSALQSWALSQAIKRCGCNHVLIDYCPDVLADKDPLNPFKNMWDQDEESQRMCRLTMPAIRENYQKFEAFYSYRFKRSKPYTSGNFDESTKEVDAYVCGSDTIFCIDEFKGFDDGYFANYDCMKHNSIAYAASFGDAKFEGQDAAVLNARLQNFRALGIRESDMIEYVRAHTAVPVAWTIDPTLLLTAEDYDTLAAEPQSNEKYLLLYTRRYNAEMEAYAERIAEEKGLKIVEISLRATNAEKGHIMRYDAGVEEFLSLVKHAEFVVTNSFHGLIFAVQYRRQVAVFTREQANTKIDELLSIFGMEACKFITGQETYHAINYDSVHERIAKRRESSLDFLRMELQCI